MSLFSIAPLCLSHPNSSTQVGQLWSSQNGFASPSQRSQGRIPARSHYQGIDIHQAFPLGCICLHLLSCVSMQMVHWWIGCRLSFPASSLYPFPENTTSVSRVKHPTSNGRQKWLTHLKKRLQPHPNEPCPTGWDSAWILKDHLDTSIIWL